MKIAIVYKNDKVKDKNFVSALIDGFRVRGYQVRTFYNGANLQGADYAIVLGGDGALLHTAVFAAKQGVKVVGINHGTLGFLSEFEAKDGLKVIDLICGEHEILPRTLLKITVDDHVFYALNETVLQRDYTKTAGSQVAEFSAFVNSEKIYDYVADGLIVATPTGSTAYSLSAGGSVLAADVEAFSLTPICPFRPCRPTVVSQSSVITFDLSKQKGNLVVCADGRAVATVGRNAKVCVEKAEFSAQFVTKNKNRLFQALNAKLLR